MAITISLIKADVGSIGGHTRPSTKMLDIVKDEINNAKNNLLIDAYVYFIGDDIGLLMSHAHGENSSKVHNFAWNTFKKAADQAALEGMYAAGQDLLADAPSGNVRGAGPGVAELAVEFGAKDRPVESFMMFAADKCGPGVFNLPLYLTFADPMYCAGLMLPKMNQGFTFNVIDMNDHEHKSLDLSAPQDLYSLAILLRDTDRFGITSIKSNSFKHKAVSVSTDRLHTISGKYVGKDDPVALVRTQGIFPAAEEVINPWYKVPYVGGGARGSHNMPILPMAQNSPVTGAYCLPIICALAFSISKDGKLSEPVDMFASPAWDFVRLEAQRKAVEIRNQGFFGAAMLPENELEYGEYKIVLKNILARFKS